MGSHRERFELISERSFCLPCLIRFEHQVQESLSFCRSYGLVCVHDPQRVLFAIDVVLKRLLMQDAPPHPLTPSPPDEEKGS